jgi:predicted nucleic acid-binding protein
VDVEERITVADTGFVVALLNRTDAKHQVVAHAYDEQVRPILLPQTVLAEVAYLVGQVAGIKTVASFLRGLPRSRFRLVALIDSDVQRIAEILQRYADSRVDFVDASVMAIAERYGTTAIFTLDHRDFRLFRPQHCEYFDLLP